MGMQPRDRQFVVRVRRSGGVTGIPRAGLLEIAHQSHSAQEESLLQLALDAREQLRGPQPTAENPLVRDAFTWSLSFDGEEHVVPDSLLIGRARELAEHALHSPRRRNDYGTSQDDQ